MPCGIALLVINGFSGIFGAMQPLNVVFISAVDLPEGGGETTRLKTLASAVRAAGHTVSILLENTSGNVDERNLQASGDIGGIPFRYILDDVKPLQGFDFFTSKYRAVKLFLKEVRALHAAGKIDVIWFNQMAFHTIYPVTRLAKRLGIKTIQSYEDDRSKGRGIKRRIIYANQVAADKYLTSEADGLVVISRYLEEKYRRLSGGKVPIALIPTVLDVDSWDAGPESVGDVPVLLYYGAFFGFDEVEKMIEAVKILKDRNIKVKLLLVGHNRRKPEYMEELARLINQLGVDEEVQMKGFTKQDKLKDYIRQANILIGLRSDSEWSRTGQSTKLSEYLATGRAVICTDIGDNSAYLNNGESAVLLRPAATSDDLARSIQFIATDNKMRQMIGANGKKISLEYFDIGSATTRINKFIDLVSKGG